MTRRHNPKSSDCFHFVIAILFVACLCRGICSSGSTLFLSNYVLGWGIELLKSGSSACLPQHAPTTIATVEAYPLFHYCVRATRRVAAYLYELKSDNSGAAYLPVRRRFIWQSTKSTKAQDRKGMRGITCASDPKPLQTGAQHIAALPSPPFYNCTVCRSLVVIATLLHAEVPFPRSLASSRNVSLAWRMRRVSPRPSTEFSSDTVSPSRS